MSTGKRRVFNREFKLFAVERYIGGESAASICRELQIRPSHLSKWCAHFRRDGPEGLRLAGRPRLAAAVELDSAAEAMRAKDVTRPGNQLGELERKAGRNQVNLDFFRRPVRQ